MRLGTDLVGVVLLGLVLGGCAHTEGRPEGRGGAGRGPSDGGTRTGFVLTGEATLPAPGAIVEAAGALGLQGLSPLETGREDLLAFEHPLGVFMATLVPVPAPGAGDLPIGPLSVTPEKAAGASAHFITAVADGPGTPRARDLAIARFSGAVALADRALAVMLGHGATFTRTEAFVEAVLEAEDEGVPVPGGVDITMAREPDGRVSLLTRGMTRYGREDLYVLSAGDVDALGEAFVFTQAVASWMLRVDAKFEDGQTIGRSAEKQVALRRVESPIDADATVLKLEL